MLASDLRRLELIGVDGKTGFPMVGTSRILTFGLPALARLMHDQIDSLGWEKAAILFARYGYEQGIGAAVRMGDAYTFDTPEELLQAGGVLGAMSGYATTTFEEIRIDREAKRLRFTGSWEETFEATLWLSQAPPTDHPVCHILTGMLSGYASAILGAEVLVRETACRAQGHPRCRFEGRTLAEWGLDAEEARRIRLVDRIDEELSRLRDELARTRENLARQNTEIKLLKTLTLHPEPDRAILCRSPRMERVLTTAEKVAATRTTVLLQGESGTGKEVIARLIHRRSAGAEKPFLAVNCAALPPALLESELFGHVRGAFTGAAADKRGLFVEAGEGTLFLDEIGEVPTEVQAKLLRALQEREIRQVGGLRDIPVQARIIAATNRDLAEMVREGRFREDLFYRLAVFPIQIPPLRERREEILLLARHFLSRLRPDHPGLSPQAVRHLEAHPWPGNVRELENWIEYAVIMAGDRRIAPEHFPRPATAAPADQTLPGLAADLPTLAELERRYTRLVLERTGGNRRETSRILGLSGATLWRRLREAPGTADPADPGRSGG